MKKLFKFLPKKLKQNVISYFFDIIFSIAIKKLSLKIKQEQCVVEISFNKSNIESSFIKIFCLDLNGNKKNFILTFKNLFK